MSQQRETNGLIRPAVRRLVREAARITVLGVLLGAGTYWTVENHRSLPLPMLPGAVISAQNPNDDAFRIGQVLRRYTRNGDNADRIARAVVSEGKRRKIDPTLLVGVMLVETDNLNPRAESFMGARGLMQVMPFHRGRWGCKSSDLYDIEGNICHGVSVLADNIKHAPSLRVALQRYNGCVRGSNTPGCSSYSGKVLRAASTAERQLLSLND
ncbi:MAG: transglycosylase SLT domain-containing protein [Gemmatimonadaceae bacterium]